MARSILRNESCVAVLLLSLLLLGCSGMPKKSPDEQTARHSVEDVVRPDVTYPIDAYDPWEGFNRGTYRFNAWFDRYIFLPIVAVYETILPNFVEDGISNFFSNLGELDNFTNNALQLKGKRTVQTVGRFAVNTTIGILGVWDPASHMGLYEQEEDFGQTLGHYKIGAGPYLILPILGPSSVRDGIGLAADSAVFREVDPLDFERGHAERTGPYYILSGIDRRHQIDFRYYESGSPFEYELIRLLYLEKRRLDIAR